jgi:hypothetical protein
MMLGMIGFSRSATAVTAMSGTLKPKLSALPPTTALYQGERELLGVTGDGGKAAW